MLGYDNSSSAAAARTCITCLLLQEKLVQTSVALNHGPPHFTLCAGQRTRECSAEGRRPRVSPEVVTWCGARAWSHLEAGVGLAFPLPPWQVGAPGQEASLSLHVDLSGLLGGLCGVEASFPQKARSKGDKRCDVFCDLISEVTLCHSHVILLVLDQCLPWKVTTQGREFTSATETSR